MYIDNAPVQVKEILERRKIVEENQKLLNDCAMCMIARFCNEKCRKRDDSCLDCNIAELSMFVGGF
jgi:hypothetical protein